MMDVKRRSVFFDRFKYSEMCAIKMANYLSQILNQLNN